jgi:hypothetical protein
MPKNSRLFSPLIVVLFSYTIIAVDHGLLKHEWAG